MTFYTKSIPETIEILNTSSDGLSKSEAEEFLLKYGENIVTVHGEPLWRKIIEPFVNIFMLVLFVAAVVSVLHDATTDALIITAIMLINATIYYVQRFSTERILRSLQKRDQLIVNVLREKQTVQIDSSKLVPGDVILLSEGERIPADARLIEVNSCRVDESQLTGESMPISKQTDALDDETEVYDRTNMVFQGSFVVGGSAKAVVTATGNNTEFGKIAVLSINTTKKSPVQQKIDHLISMIIRVISAIALVALFLALYRGMDLTEGIRYVLALSVSAVPESLPVAITVVLVLGMRRMAKKKALVKAMNAIESVGCVTMIATDKTGTLTKNLLTVQDVWSASSELQDLKHCVKNSINFSESKTFDPLDTALINYISNSKLGSRHEVASTLPFDQEYSMSGNIVKFGSNNTLYVKGAPESILSRSKLSKSEHENAMSILRSMAGEGLRVIAFAHCGIKSIFTDFDGMDEGQKFVFDGFVAIADVLRLESKSAIAQAQQAGIEVCMITGDHFETAFHIGKKLGIVEHPDQVFDSRKMNNLSDRELEKAIKEVRVFARVTPENKYRILSVFKNENIVAMTGDGVNDVPALSNAHVGVAMGSGASIAKDAGSIILLDNNFKSIIDAVHEGRTIYANIKRMVAYLLSTNAGEVLVALGSLIVGIPVPLLPVQILWVNLVTDSCLVIPLGLEPGEKRNMKKPPQSLSAPLFSKFMISRIILVAVTMTLLTLYVYATEAQRGSLEYARTAAFHALVVMQWISAFCYRSDYESFFIRIKRINPAFILGLIVAISMQLLAVLGPLRDLLGLEKLLISDILNITLVSIVVPLIVVELHKWIGRRFFKKGHKT